MDFALGDMGMKEFNKGCEIWFWTRSMHKKAKKEKKGIAGQRKRWAPCGGVGVSLKEVGGPDKEGVAWGTEPIIFSLYLNSSLYITWSLFQVLLNFP